MKSKPLVLSLLGMLSVYGCSLPDPLDLREKCSDETHGLTAVVHNRTVCHAEDVTGELKEVCGKFADAFAYGYCPPDAPICIRDEEKGTFTCSLSKCAIGFHEHDAKCERNTLLHCGRHGGECEKVLGWLDGRCDSDELGGVKCAATACEDGYKLDEENEVCIAVIECGENEHIANGECEPDSVQHCGRHKAACSQMIKGWADGQCVQGVCVPSACEDGYKLDKDEDGSYCVPTVECLAGEHIYVTTVEVCETSTMGEEECVTETVNCEADTVSNCGHHGNSCTSIDGWMDGNCVEGRCHATACFEGYDLNKETMSCRFKRCDAATEYLHDNKCWKNSLEHCGSYSTDCTASPGWLSGECRYDESKKGVICVADACEPKGYDLTDGQCVAKTSCEDPDKYYYEGECLKNSIENCGKHLNRCDVVAGWSGGECILGQCVATACDTGYDLKEGQCVAKTSCDDPDTHYYNGACLTNDLGNCGKHNNSCTNIIGWAGGECTNGVCVPSECQTGYHLNEGSCVADDSNNCGSVGNKCGLGEVCTQGACSDNCGSGEVRCEKDGNVSCADPNTSTNFCGADATCSTYEICENGQTCVSGRCVQNACLNVHETLCVVDGENQCLSLNSNNVNHCGACNHRCEEQQAINAHSNVCRNGRCEFVCHNNFTNCGTDVLPDCIQNERFADDSYNCGGCGNRCDDDEYCSGGSCLKSTCTNACLSGATCVNENNKCGTQCVDCNTVNNAAVGECNSGQCVIRECARGYHLNGDKCEVNSATACAPVSSSAVVNCTHANHASDGYCNADGACVSTGCEQGYHVVNGACVQDTEKACGALAVDCTALSGWAGGACIGGQCQATSCKSGYCLSGTTCVDGSYNSLMCGTDGSKCNACGPGKSCSAGTCITSSCGTNVCFYQGSECENAATHCGSACMDCNTSGNASAGTCESGVCKITKCATGYHLKGSAGSYTCEANTATLCGKTDSTQVTNCTSANNASNGICGLDGTCTITNCKADFHLDGGTCVADSVNACGSSDVNCTSLTGWAEGTCTGGQCRAVSCQSGYCLNGTTCVDGKFNSMMCGLAGGAQKCGTCGSGTSCVNGECVTSSCDANVCFYQGTECSNADDHCGKSCTNCNTAGNASTGKCEGGACKITRCAAGYHLSGNPGSYICEANSTVKCGPVDSVSIVNCGSHNNATSGVCNSDGHCVALTCKTGYHVVKGACVKDSETACGASATNCRSLAGWNGGTCTNGQCQATSCQANYCLSGTTCVDGSFNSLMCGTDGSKCNACGSGKSCSAGQCITSSCGTNVCFYQGSVCENAATHCGSACLDCNTSGNASAGTCESGVCKITKCATGYHLKGSAGSYTCEANTATLCGKTDSTQVTNCTTANNASNGICGLDGTCIITSCKSNFHLKEGICVPDSVTECGASATNCTNLMGWAGGSCTGGQCKATSCASNYCLSGTTCVDGSFNSLMCGVGGGSQICETCGSGKSCVSGVCKQSECDANVCFYQGSECSNADDHCGKSCTNCNTAGNASAGTCDGGTCKITRCAAGYHLKGNAGSYICEANSTTSCGPVGSVSIVNCNSHGNATSGACNSDGQCVALTCKTGYHVVNGACVKDTETACGASAINCKGLSGWSGGTCTNGQCQATSCASGYCLSGTTCVDGSYNSLMCGINGGTCGSCGSGKSCVNGTCQQSGCETNVCFYQGNTCSNTADHCGAACKNCNTEGHAATGSCTSSGTCKITTCAVGYHLTSSSTCDQNTPTSCGPVGSVSIKNCMTENNATAGYCDASGTCIATACKTGYHVSNGKCVSDSTTACGASAVNCTGLTGWGGGSCTGGQCLATSCKTGYCLNGTTCVDGSYNTLTCGMSGGACRACDSGTLCVSGICKQSGCSSNVCFYQGDQCSNTADHCGAACKNCNVEGHAAAGTCTSSGTCKITTCAVGYHLTSASACDQNTPTSCGPVGSVSIKNCMTEGNATVGYCDTSGACVATACKTGYHVENNKCVADSETACGFAMVNCKNLDGWSGGKCVNGECIANACASGYCLNGTKCSEGTSAMSCGNRGGTSVCKVCGSSEACINGSCTPTTCSGTQCSFNHSCVNETEHCGKNCVNCNTANNASAGICNSSTGTCSITTCAKGYHKSGTSCVVNRNTSCAPPNSSVEVNCMTNGNAASGVCDPEGQCVIITCATGYTLSGGQCVESGGGSACTDHYTTIDVDGSSVRAYCIETLQDFKNVYNGTVTSATGAYILMDNFNLNNVTSSDWKPIFGSGFSGIFYGNSKTLSGTFTCSSTSCGLVGPLTNAKIMNLNLNVSFNGGLGFGFGAVSRSASQSTLKNITSSGTLRSSGDAGGIVGSVSNGTTVSNCHVTGNIRAAVGHAGGIAYSVTSSTIENCSYSGDIRAEDYYTGGLVGSLEGSSTIKSSFVSERANIIRGDSAGGGLVGGVSGKDNRISMSYCAGSVTGSGDSRLPLGGLVGEVTGGLTIEKSVVFGNINSTSNDVVVGGLIGSFRGGNVTIQSSASVGDIEAPSSTVAGIAHIEDGTLTVHDLYHLGKINGLRTSYDDFVHGGGEIVSKHYLSWVKLQQYIEHDSISIAGNELLAKESGKNLVTDLNQYTKSNFGEESWTTSMCTITTGPAGGEMIKYNLPLPRGLPKRPSFCE